MQGEDPQLGRQVVARLPGLATSHPAGDHNVTEQPRFIGWKRQHVGGFVVPPKVAVELLNPLVGHQRHRDVTACAPRCHPTKPSRQGIRFRAAADDLHLEAGRATPARRAGI
jgi:hypothetical protein